MTLFAQVLSVPCADWNSCQAGHTHNYWQMPDEPIHLEQLDGSDAFTLI